MSDISRDALKAVFVHSDSRPRPASGTKPLMGGTATLTLLGGRHELLEQCWSFLDELEQLWSRFLPDSDITRLNWANGQPVEVDERTILLINEMKDGVVRTEGRFDPTRLPDVLALGYDASRVDSRHVTHLPASAVSPGRIDLVEASQQSVTMPVGTTLDAGGIGKGFAADLVSSFALERGAWGVMAEIAGDVRVAGEAPNGIAWRLGVENPFSPRSHRAIVRIPDGGVVTSSQLKKRFGKDSLTHHLIDTANGKSAVTTVATVTVIARTAAIAETLTKPGFTQPVTNYLDWLPRQGAAGFVIGLDGTTHESDNWSLYQ
ncbi:MAG: FAD:protein FMN transferase [Microbacteriaceae bacterium]|nr:FAD:protein FMN transferase [Microbacteriaceae bacterium]